MNIDKDRLYFTKNGIEMFVSLQKAITQAGGVPPNILNMTVIELITLLGVNGIRFHFQGHTNEPVGEPKLKKASLICKSCGCYSYKTRSDGYSTRNFCLDCGKEMKYEY